MPKRPEYVRIADTLRAELLAGKYDEDALPSNAALAERFDVNLKTAGRAVQHLIAEGLVIARPGMRAVPAPLKMRATKWPMTGRYARARAAQGLIFAGDVAGEIRKVTVQREWVRAPASIAHFLNIKTGTREFQRRSLTYVNDVVAENTYMFFPSNVVKSVPRLETEDNIQVVPFIEQAGYVITRTVNEIRARHANPTEQELFDIKATDIVFEHSHGTYGASNEPLEAVVNVRPAKNNVLTFDTYEGPIQGE